MVKKYFKDESLTDMFLKIKAILRNPIKEQAKNMKVAIIKSGLWSLNNDMEDMSESEIKNKRLNELLMFIEELLNKLGKKSQEDLSKEYVPPRYFKKEGK